MDYWPLVYSNIELSTQYVVLGNKSVWYGRIDVIISSAEEDVVHNMRHLDLDGGIKFAYFNRSSKEPYCFVFFFYYSSMLFFFNCEREILETTRSIFMNFCDLIDDDLKFISIFFY